MLKIVLASNNPGKIREFSELLKNLHIEILPQSQMDIAEADELGLTFIENAIIKARHATRATGLPAIADDSGLVVPILGGEPGIHSARYAGVSACAQDNINKLLKALEDVPDEERSAYFYCTLVLMIHDKDPTPVICHGKWQGRILHNPKGEGGFGYDPIFYVPSENKTAAELPLIIKNRISHRGIALQTLLNVIPEVFQGLSTNSQL